MGIALTRPEWLLLAPVVAAALVWSARDSFADLAGMRRRVAWVLRAVIMSALVLALAGAQLVLPTRNLEVVFALDGSHSVPEAERERALGFIREALAGRRPDHRAALVVFGRRAVVESDSLLSPDQVRVRSDPSGGYTDLSAGLRLALGLVPPQWAGRVVLLSDGNENVGSAAQEALAARAGGVSVDVVPLGTRAQRDVMVGELDVPATARRGEPVPVRVPLRASQPAGARITVLVDDRPVQTRELTMAAGSSSLSIPISVDEPGFHRVDALVDAEGDDQPENDIGTAFVRVRGEPKVLVADSHPGELRGLRRALSLQDIDVTVAGPQAIPTSAEDLESWDALVLSDLPAWNLDERQMKMIRDAVRDRGIGLAMLGGELSFGAGGYYRTPIEEALPVTMDVTKQRTFPAAAVLI
ncbi:MAG TPA: VWA domain-containing protein, partial [Armatimonadota bacterium]|nr:VWA domain-containing protein [Armatimonadota bacterium]